MNKDLPQNPNIIELIEQETITRTPMTAQQSQPSGYKSLENPNMVHPLVLNSGDTSLKKNNTSDFERQNITTQQMSGNLAIQISQKCETNMVSEQKKPKGRRKNKKSKQKEVKAQDKKETQAPSKKQNLIPQKNGNSIRKKKESKISKTAASNDRPSSQNKVNILSMIQNMPISLQKQPAPKESIKMEADTSVNQVKEWCIQPFQNSNSDAQPTHMNISAENSKIVQLEQLVGTPQKIQIQNQCQNVKQNVANMAPLDQNLINVNYTAQDDNLCIDQKLKSPEKVKQNTIEIISQKVQEWKSKRLGLFKELTDHLKDSNLMVQNNAHCQLSISEMKDKFENRAKSGQEILQNKKDLSQPEVEVIINEIKRFADLTSPKDQSSFLISNECKLLIFKIFAFLVDSSKLELTELAQICERYLLDNIKQLLAQHNLMDLNIKAISMIRKGAIKLTDIIQQLAERKIYGVKNFHQKFYPENNCKDNIENEGMLIDEFQDKNVLNQTDIKATSDTNDDSFYSLALWELSGDASLYISAEKFKTLKIDKPIRTKINQKAAFLEKIILLIDKLKKDKDIAKIEEEYQKYQNFLEREKQAIEKQQLNKIEKEKKERLEQEKLQLKEQERLLKEKEKLERQQQQEQEKKQKLEQIEREKKERQEKLEKERQEKQERIEKEKRERLERIEKEKKERQERIDREKREKAEKVELERLAKEKLQKEEAERKAKEEAEKAELLKKRSLFKYLQKPPQAAEPITEGNCNVNEQTEKGQGDIGNKNVINSNNEKNLSKLIEYDQTKKLKECVEERFNGYGSLTSFAIKMQKERFLLKLQNDQSQIDSFIPQYDTDIITNQQQFEMQNKIHLSQHFKMLNKNLDPYLQHPEKYEITYSQVGSKQQTKTDGNTTLIINHNPGYNNKTQSNKIYRRKLIIIDDQLKSTNLYLDKFNNNQKITCRNPFKMDNQLFNYDMDTEDEWAEENGEDLNQVDNEGRSNDEDDGSESSDEQQGFIVDDDYLSMSEMNLSNISKDELIQEELERRKQILQRNRESKEKQIREQQKTNGPQIFLFSHENQGMMYEFAAINFLSDCQMATLVRMIHGSLESKPKLIDDFYEQNPECSKNSIERKIKEYFIKDKRNEDPIKRYYATDEILAQLEVEFPEGKENSELKDLEQKRLQPLLDEIKNEQNEIQERKEKELQEKERERQELMLMRQEEQNQRDYKRQQERLIERQEREAKKIQIKQQQEEEKKRLRDQKQKEKQEQIEQQIKIKEEQKAQKAIEKQIKKEQKEQKEQKENEDKKTKEQDQLAKAIEKKKSAENIISMLKKRNTSNILNKIQEIEATQVKKQKIDPQQKQEQKPENEKEPQKLQNSGTQSGHKGSLTDFFKKLPTGERPSPFKLDLSREKMSTNKDSVVKKEKSAQKIGKVMQINPKKVQNNASKTKSGNSKDKIQKKQKKESSNGKKINDKIIKKEENKVNKEIIDKNNTVDKITDDLKLPTSKNLSSRKIVSAKKSDCNIISDKKQQTEKKVQNSQKRKQKEEKKHKQKTKEKGKDGQTGTITNNIGPNKKMFEISKDLKAKK